MCIRDRVITVRRKPMLEETQDEQEIIARVAALDIGKAELVCCVRVPDPKGGSRRVQEVKSYSTMTRSLQVMADRLMDLGVTRILMEATSDYWKPPFYLLEAHGFEVWLVNARDVKNLPGRPKTDRLDAVWLCKVAEPVSYTHLRAHETVLDLVCRLLLEKKKKNNTTNISYTKHTQKQNNNAKQ